MYAKVWKFGAGEWDLRLARQNELLARDDVSFPGPGRICVDNNIVADERLPVIPRIGMQCGVVEKFSLCEWFGRGPHENYIDRQNSAFVSRFKSNVVDLAVPYIHPTENGGRSDVRWVALLDSSGTGLRVGGDQLLQFSAHYCTTKDLDLAKHTIDIPRRNAVSLNIDHKHMGLGGDDSWSPRVHAPYLIKPGLFRYRLFVRAIDAGESPAGHAEF